MTAPATTPPALDGFVAFLASASDGHGVFADDVHVAFASPLSRVTADGRPSVVALRRSGHPWPGTVHVLRVDRTGTGWAADLEERWHAGGQDWYCQEFFRADVVDNRISDLLVYCTGDWDEAHQARQGRGPQGRG